MLRACSNESPHAKHKFAAHARGRNLVTRAPQGHTEDWQGEGGCVQDTGAGTGTGTGGGNGGKG